MGGGGEGLAAGIGGIEGKGGGASGGAKKMAKTATTSTNSLAKNDDSDGAGPAKDKAEPKKKPEPQAEDKPTTRYLSADDSNSQASPVIARKMIRAGRYVQPHTVRTYEFLNYYSFDYPAPTEAPAAVTAHMRKLNDPEKPDTYALNVAVRSQDKPFEQLAPLHVTFLIDASGSMAGQPIDLAKTFVDRFAKRLRPGVDTISIVAVNRAPRVLLEGHKVGPETVATVTSTLGQLSVTDITDLEKGVVAAYEVAGKTYSGGALNRVILISDGADNAGPSALKTISKFAEDSDKQGIYLAGVGVGAGFNDQLMNAFTDKGRGAYLFVDGEASIERALEPKAFVANFDVALKNVRLKMVMPAGWAVKAFHGEQMSAVASEVTPQYLSPNDQMIYALEIASTRSEKDRVAQTFEFEAELTPMGQPATKIGITSKVSEMLADNRQIQKVKAVVAYAELLKAIKFPLEEHRADNQKAFDKTVAEIEALQSGLQDPEVASILELLGLYKVVIWSGEQHDSPDKTDASIAAAIGLNPNALVGEVETRGANPKSAIAVLDRLGNSVALRPQEGHRFLVMSSGPVGNTRPAGSGQLSKAKSPDPTPKFMGQKAVSSDGRPIFDAHQVTFKVKAPANAKSFSVDFNFFSAEYPQFVNQNFNDSFYVVIEAPNTHGGATTNIAFDSERNAIEVDSNYFQRPFHPIPNTGTGFDNNGSTGWLRTSWPVTGGQEIRVTFSIHDEGDGIYDSLAVIDNFQFHDYPAVGTTDPLN